MERHFLHGRRRGQRVSDRFEAECPIMANGDRPRMAVGADAGHAGNFRELPAGLNEKLSVAAPGDPQPDAPRREMRNLRIVQKMHHMMDSGLLLFCCNCRRIRRLMPQEPDSGCPQVMHPRVVVSKFA